MSPTPKEWSDSLRKAVDESMYNCDCQVGGVDALSIDSDYLDIVADVFSEAVAAIGRVRAIHESFTDSSGTYCRACFCEDELGRWKWPCDTLDALGGVQA